MVGLAIVLGALFTAALLLALMLLVAMATAAAIVERAIDSTGGAQ